MTEGGVDAAAEIGAAEHRRAPVHLWHPARTSGASARDFKAEVSVVEPTGSETQVFAKVGGHQIVGVFRDRVSAQPGETLLLSPNLDAVHLFDAESGKRLE